MTRQQLLGDLLKSVSRAFYLSMRVLPPGSREPIGLGYLLARAADTIADTDSLPAAERLHWLNRLRAQLTSPEPGAMSPLVGLITDSASPSERALLAQLERALEMLATLESADRELVDSIVSTLIEGMRADLEHFPPGTAMHSLETAADLDRHTYLAAGCVGEFWTRVTVRHERALARSDQARLIELGVRFGKALQLVNVLRDLPEDLAKGRCYLPRQELAELGLTPEELRAGSVPKPLLLRWLGVALGHFAAAEAYLTALPRHCLRLRLAVLWPILIGLETLALVGRRAGHPGPAKVSRGWVYRMLLASPAVVWSNHLLRIWLNRLRRPLLEQGVRPQELRFFQ